VSRTRMLDQDVLVEIAEVLSAHDSTLGRRSDPARVAVASVPIRWSFAAIESQGTP
jgi:hypothetical protein